MTLDATLLALRPDPHRPSRADARDGSCVSPPLLFRRADGRCGARNFLGVVAMDPAAEHLAHAVVDRVAQSDLVESLDGVLALAYAPGASMSGLQAQRGQLDQLLCARGLHPNLGALLLLDSGFPGAASRRCQRELESVTCDGVAQLSAHGLPVAAFLDQACRSVGTLARVAARRRRLASTWPELVFGLSGTLRPEGMGAGLRNALARLVARGATVVFPESMSAALLQEASVPVSAYGQRVVRPGWVPMAGSPVHADAAPGLVAAGAQLLIEATAVSMPANVFSDAVPRLRLPVHRDADWMLARISEALAGQGGSAARD